MILINQRVNDRQKKFCLYYLQFFNVKKAAKKVGYSEGYGQNLMCKEHIKQEFSRLKTDMFKDMMVDGKDVLELYIRIAFADVRDFVEFGNYLDDKHAKKSYVYLKEDCDVDGQIIDEVTISAYGAKIKLCDRFRALEKLEKFFDLMGYDSWKKFMDEQKLKLRDNGLERVINVVTGINRNEESGETYDKV